MVKQYEPTLQELEEMRKFFEGARKLPTPSPEQIRARMAELRDMGLEDVPTMKGFSSSMRQYAWNTLGHTMEMAKEGAKQEPCYFVTMDKLILERSEALAEKFGVIPISMEAFMERMELEEKQSEEKQEQSG